MQRVPVIGRGYDDGLQVFLFEQLSKIPVRLGFLAAGCHTLFEARLVDVAHPDQVGVVLIAEVANVLAADESVADETDLHAVIGAENSLIRCSRGSTQESSSRRGHGGIVSETGKGPNR